MYGIFGIRGPFQRAIEWRRCDPLLIAGHEACLLGSAVMLHGGDRSVDDDPGKCFVRYSEERDAAVVRACQGIVFPFPEGNDYSVAPISRDLLC